MNSPINVVSTQWHNPIGQMPAMALPPVNGFGYHQVDVNSMTAPVFVPPPIPSNDGHGPGAGLLTGTARAFLKDELPPETRIIGTVASAAIAGHRLAANITRAENEGQTPAEAIGCQTARTITQELTGKLSKGAIVAGIPTYLSAAVASPPLAATLPVVLPLIPIAYQGAEQLAQAVGNLTEEACHNAFERARQLTKGE